MTYKLHNLLWAIFFSILWISCSVTVTIIISEVAAISLLAKFLTSFSLMIIFGYVSWLLYNVQMWTL